MLLAVDVGNTQTVFGLYDGDRLAEHWRVSTEAERTGDELGVLVGRLLELRDVGFEEIGGVCLASTVPPLVRAYEEFARDYADARLLVLGPGTRTGIPIVYDDPREVGPDRIANAVAARERYGAPSIVVDFGTSTNFDIVSAAGEYLGGVIGPGVEISMEALTERTAKLPRIDLTEPAHAIGKNTQEAMESGFVHGFAGLVDGITRRVGDELGDEATVIATGGLASAIVPYCETIDEVDDLLTLTGLRLIYDRNARSS
jgi:type III pantothenate kinase